jgi:uncharacterized RDD family membrane protein YckC
MSELPPRDGDDSPQLPQAAPTGPAAYPDQASYPVAAPIAPGLQRPGPAPGLVYAGFGWRLLGYVLDVVIVFVIEAPLTIPLAYVPIAQYYHDHAPAAGQTVATLPADLSNRFLLVGLFGALVSAVYFGGLVAWQGRTLGQRAMGAFVVREEDGSRLPAGRAYLRAVIFWGPGVLGLIPTVGSIAGLIALIGLLSAAWDQRKQGWHDKLARSLVLRRVPL